MKKIIATVILFVLSISILTACGGNTTSSSESATPSNNSYENSSVDTSVSSATDYTWENSELAQLLPQPGFTVSINDSTSTRFQFTSEGTTADQLKDYTNKCKEMGFVNNPTEEDMEESYTYIGTNNEGYTFKIMVITDIGYMVILKAS